MQLQKFKPGQFDMTVNQCREFHCGPRIKNLYVLLLAALLAACPPTPDNLGIGYLDQPVPGLELEKQSELIVVG